MYGMSNNQIRKNVSFSFLVESAASIKRLDIDETSIKAQTRQNLNQGNVSRVDPNINIQCWFNFRFFLLMHY